MSRPASSQPSLWIAPGGERTELTHWLWVAPSANDKPMGMWLEQPDNNLAVSGWTLVVDTPLLKVREQRGHLQFYIHEDLLDT